MLGRIHFVTAGKAKEYTDFLMGLTILVVDGISVAALAKLCKANAKFTKNMKSVGCLRLVLEDLGLSESAADDIVSPMQELQAKRSKYGAHCGGTLDFDVIEDCRKTLSKIEGAFGALRAIVLKAA